MHAPQAMLSSLPRLPLGFLSPRQQTSIQHGSCNTTPCPNGIVMNRYFRYSNLPIVSNFDFLHQYSPGLCAPGTVDKT
jgi:hypothetical protein